MPSNSLSLLENILLLELGIIILLCSAAAVEGVPGIPHPAGYQAIYPSREARGAPQGVQLSSDAQVCARMQIGS